MKFLMKSVHFYVYGGHLKTCVKKYSFSMPYCLGSEKFSHKSLQCPKKSTACAWRRLNLNHRHHQHFFTRSSGCGSVRCTDSTAGQSVSELLAKRLEPGVAHFRCHIALHVKVLSQNTLVCKKPSARARGRSKLP